MFENSANEVREIFSHLSHSNGLDTVREDFGLEAHDLLLLEEGFSPEEVEILEAEVTPEIRRILEQAMLSQAFQDLTDWEKARALVRHLSDQEKELNTLVDIQETMATGMKYINQVNAQRQEALAALDSWIKRYNSWKNSDKFQAYKDKSGAAKIFFNGLNIRKSEYHRLKSLHQNCWNRWHELQKQSQEFGHLWGQYFQLAEYQPGDGFIAGDTEDVDDFALMAKDDAEVMKLLRDTHSLEMREYDAPEAHGIGFWNFKEEFKTEKRAEAQQKRVDLIAQEDEAFWMSVETVDDSQMNFNYLFE